MNKIINENWADLTKSQQSLDKIAADILVIHDTLSDAFEGNTGQGILIL